MTGRQQANDHDRAPVLPTATRESGNTTESNALRSTSRNNGTLLTGWDHSQGSTPHKAKTSQNSSVESLPQPQKPTKDAEATKEQQAPRHGNGKIGIRDRIQHLTWAWFTTTMSTGGLALVLGQTPHRFRGLDTIGKAVFILDLVLFLLLAAGITTRFALGPRGALQASLTDPTEAFFLPTFMLSISTIISNTQIYGQHAASSWLPAALRVVFWLYAALALLVAILLYLALFTTPRVHAKCGPGAAAPNWVLPVFPAMLCGTLSGLLAPHQADPAAALTMIVAGVSLQGLGWLLFCFVAALFLQRLFGASLVPRSQRPAMFMMVGPPSFTALALVANAKALPEAHAYFAEDHPGARDGLVVLATWTADMTRREVLFNTISPESGKWRSKRALPRFDPQLLEREMDFDIPGAHDQTLANDPITSPRTPEGLTAGVPANDPIPFPNTPQGRIAKLIRDQFNTDSSKRQDGTNNIVSNKELRR
ncbi:hypothetical protein SLS58_010949 [Diplodia intermedia]|uniref:C4-dicarboxylate transporter malic acid transport protein n=1 Tax=Diplodia intermedia TaxID=856260 RepID=A0ABR3T2E5_9PEZI